MTNLDSIFKSRDITLPTKIRVVKAMVFPVVMYGCESKALLAVPNLGSPVVKTLSFHCWRYRFDSWLRN